jgi:hypothetical protein
MNRYTLSFFLNRQQSITLATLDHFTLLEYRIFCAIKCKNFTLKHLYHDINLFILEMG